MTFGSKFENFPLLSLKRAICELYESMIIFTLILGFQFFSFSLCEFNSSVQVSVNLGYSMNLNSKIPSYIHMFPYHGLDSTTRTRSILETCSGRIKKIFVNYCIGSFHRKSNCDPDFNPDLFPTESNHDYLIEYTSVKWPQNAVEKLICNKRFCDLSNTTVIIGMIGHTDNTFVNILFENIDIITYTPLMFVHDKKISYNIDDSVVSWTSAEMCVTFSPDLETCVESEKVDQVYYKYIFLDDEIPNCNAHCGVKQNAYKCAFWTDSVSQIVYFPHNNKKFFLNVLANVIVGEKMIPFVYESVYVDANVLFINPDKNWSVYASFLISFGILIFLCVLIVVLIYVTKMIRQKKRKNY